MTTAVLTYTATVVLSTGATYSYSGTQALPATSSVALNAGVMSMGSDLANQMINGTAVVPSLAAQQQTTISQG